jgi:transposase
LRLRLSRRRIQEFLGDWLGPQLSVATINQCLHEAARALEPVLEEQLLPEVRDSDLIHADETSWKEHGRLLWLWVFTTATTTVFAIGRRSQDLLHGVLGAVLTGWLMSDGYWAYRDYENRLRCLTHLLRKARGLEDSLAREGQRFGKALRVTIEGVMQAVYAAREGPPSMGLREQFAEQLLNLCIAHSAVTSLGPTSPRDCGNIVKSTRPPCFRPLTHSRRHCLFGSIWMGGLNGYLLARFHRQASTAPVAG